MRHLKIKLNAFIRAEVVEFYGERGVFIPLRYNAEETPEGVFATIRMGRSARKAGVRHRMEGTIAIPEEQKDKLLMNTRSFGITQPVVYEYGTERAKRGTPKKKLLKSGLDDLLEKEVSSE